MNAVKTITRAAKTAVAATALAGIALSTVQAGSASAWSWNDYTASLPEFVTGPTAFEVLIDGTSPVCSMEYLGTTLTAAPWVFTYDPDARSWGRVEVTACDGDKGFASVRAEMAFDVRGQFVFKGQWDTTDAVEVVNNMSVPSTVTVTNPKGAVVTTSEIPAAASAEVKVPLKGAAATGVYVLTMTGANGITQTHKVIAAKGWTPLMESAGAAFAPCSALTWSLNTHGQPRNAKGIARDIARSLTRLAKETGLKFDRVPASAGASITYSWKPMGQHGPSGVGGFGWSSGGASQANVEFNNQDSWPTDRYAGFASGKRSNGYGPAGRGWLIIHETMHALGFGHVEDDDAVMAPVNRGQSDFTKGDLEGLHTLYPKNGCK
jgi:hypothetical protein